jgi:hypothetical protein
MRVEYKIGSGGDALRLVHSVETLSLGRLMMVIEALDSPSERTSNSGPGDRGRLVPSDIYVSEPGPNPFLSWSHHHAMNIGVAE